MNSACKGAPSAALILFLGQGRRYIPAMPRRLSKKDTPAKLAGRMKRRWRVVLLRAKGEILGTVEAPDVAVGQGGRRGPV